MSVVVQLIVQPFDRAGYDAVAGVVGWTGSDLDGLELHIAVVEGKALRVVDVWTDEGTARAFLDDEALPALRGRGIDDIVVTIEPAARVRITHGGPPRRILVVANRTLGSAELDRTLRTHLANERCELHLLVPAEPVANVGGGDEFGDPALPAAGAARSSEELARHRLYAELDRLHGDGIEATGEVTGEDAVDAVRKVLRTRHVDEIVLSTLPPGVSRWLGRDLPSRLQRAVDVPVSVVVAATAADE